MLEEGECEHRHEGMTVKALPGSSLEVVEAEFLFQLLMGLFTNPSPLDGRRRCADRSRQADLRGSISSRQRRGVRR